MNDDDLSAAIHATFQNRGTQYFASHPLFTKEFVMDQERNRHWSRFLKKIKQDNDLSFETVMMLITARLEPIYESFKEGNQ